jgi:hypothetical protein
MEITIPKDFKELFALLNSHKSEDEIKKAFESLLTEGFQVFVVRNLPIDAGNE